MPAGAVFKSVDVVTTPKLNICEYFGNVSSQTPDLSACLVQITGPCEEPYQIAEFDEWVLVTSGLFVVNHGDGQTTVAKAGEGMFIKGGMRVKISWPGPCQYIPICMPAFSPAICHREGEGEEKDAEALKRLSELHVKAGSETEAKEAKTISNSAVPIVFKSVDVVTTDKLVITEYVGNVASKESGISACLATVTEACEEAYQAPEFDEYVLVVAGELILRQPAGDTLVKQGEGILLKAGERVKWVWPGPCQYVPICLPAFNPANCHREEDEVAVKDPEAIKRLENLHEVSNDKAVGA